MGGGGRDKPMAINETAERGRAVVSVYADGRVTGLSVHLREGTRLAVRAYPAEGRVVLEAGRPGPRPGHGWFPPPGGGGGGGRRFCQPRRAGCVCPRGRLAP